jgi:hypothetical protein
LNPTHNKTILVNSSEYNLFKDDKKSRYSVFTINDEYFYVSNQWRKSTIDGFIDYFENKLQDTVEFTEFFEEEDVEPIVNKYGFKLSDEFFEKGIADVNS